MPLFNRSKIVVKHVEPDYSYAFLPCGCGALDHNIIIERCQFAEDDVSYELYLTLEWSVAWYKRLWLATKYVLGYRPLNSIYHSICIYEEDAKSLGLDRLLYCPEDEFKKKETDRKSTEDNLS